MISNRINLAEFENPSCIFCGTPCKVFLTSSTCLHQSKICIGCSVKAWGQNSMCPCCGQLTPYLKEQFTLTIPAETKLSTSDFECILMAGIAYGRLYVVDLVLRRCPLLTRIPCHLCAAAFEGDIHVITSLVESDADVNCMGQDGISPLQIAAGRNWINVVDWFLFSGADINHMDNFGITATFVAAEKGNIEVLQYLLTKGAALQSCNNGVSELLIAVKNGHAKIVEFLLSIGADANKACRLGYSPLMEAAKIGHMWILQELLNNGANPDQESVTGLTALSTAACAGHLDIVKYLVQSRANVNKLSKGGSSPLSAAARNGHLRIIIFLIAHDAKVRDSNFTSGHTPLTHAVDGGHLGVVEHLIRNGAGNQKTMKAFVEKEKNLMKYSAELDHLRINQPSKRKRIGKKGKKKQLLYFVMDDGHVIYE